MTRSMDDDFQRMKDIVTLADQRDAALAAVETLAATLTQLVHERNDAIRDRDEAIKARDVAIKERDEALASDAESLMMYRRARDRADQLQESDSDYWAQPHWREWPADLP